MDRDKVVVGNGMALSGAYLAAAMAGISITGRSRVKREKKRGFTGKQWDANKSRRRVSKASKRRNRNK